MIVEIDLSDQTFEFYELEENIFYKWLGGRGLGVYFLKRYRNSIVISRGVLSKVPGLPGRASAVFISPKTKGIFYSNSGGNIQHMLPFSIIIKGESEKPVYINIERDKVEFLDASKIFNFDRYETFKYLENKYRNKIILAIGSEFNENLNLMNNKHGFFGRGGLGYLFYKKNLKAVVIEYNKDFSTKITNEYLKIYKEILLKLKKNKIIRELSEGGTVKMLLKELGERKWLPIDIDYKKYLELWEKYNKKSNACLGCPIACKKNFEFWGGLISFYLKGYKSLEKIEEKYEEFNKKGLDAVFNDHMICIKEDVFSLALATSNRGDLNQLILTKMFREDKMEDVIKYVIDVQNEIAIVDSLVVCGFTLYTLSLKDYSEILNSLGYSFTEEDLYKIGDRIYKEEMKMNLELGFKYKREICKRELIERYCKERKISI